MSDDPRASPIERACAALRRRSLATDEGALLGSEETLYGDLGISRSTIRQAARILETEGLITVRRGTGGGYFAARPKLSIIENAASAYLMTRAVAPRDTLAVGSLIWPEAVRRAAQARPEPADLRPIERLIAQAVPEMGGKAFSALEKDITRAIMRLAQSDFIEFILDLNLSFFRISQQDDLRPLTATFLAAWQAAHRMELAAIAAGDEELAQFAGRRFRTVLNEWVIRDGEPILKA